MLKKYNTAAKKSKSAREEILGNSHCGSMPAEKLGHVEIIFQPHFTWTRVFIVLGT